MQFMRKSRVLLLVVAAFMLIPAAAGQDTIENPNESTPTTLYFHVFDTINRFVINTQPMDADFFDVGGANYPSTPDFDLPLPGTGLPLQEGWNLNTIYGYSTAGPVEYDFTENGKPRFHPERGIAATVNIDSAVDPVVYLYFDVRDAVGSDTAPTSLPEFTVRVTLQEGDDPGLDANLDDGKDIMTGETTIQIIDSDLQPDPGVPCDATCCEPGEEDIYIDCLAMHTLFGWGRDMEPTPIPVPVDDAIADGSRDSGVIEFVSPDENGIIEVALPLTLHQDYIPKKEAYNVRVDWYQADDVFGEDQFTTGWLRLASDSNHLSRLEFNIMNPVYFSFIHPQVAGGSLLIHAGGNSPWGTYDVDLEKVTIEVTHDSGKKVPQSQLKKILNSNEHVHGLHDEDAQLTYLWDFRDHGAELGEYTIAMTLTNDAEDGDDDYADSSTAFGEAKFIVTETEAIGIDTTGEEVESTSQSNDEVEAPGVGILAALALLGAALFARRRFA